MNKEEFKNYVNEIAKNELRNSFDNNLMETLNSAFIFKYVETLEKENKELKKQLEESYTSVYLKGCEDTKYKNQQKEFIAYLENEKNIYPYDISDYTYEDIINTILSKYYEIIDKQKVVSNNVESERQCRLERIR